MEKTYELKTQTGKLEAQLLAGEFVISRELYSNGTLVITCTPSEMAAKELDSLLNSVNKELEQTNISIANLSSRALELDKTIKNIEALLKR